MEAVIVEERDDEVYLHYINENKRLDEWRSRVEVTDVTNDGSPSLRGQKRKRGTSASASGSRGQSIDVQGEKFGSEDVSMTEEELDLREHQRITAKRNFDKVRFGQWQIRTW